MPAGAMNAGAMTERRDDDDRRTRVNVEREGDRPQDVGIRLTLAVDTRTSELLLSCDETLFQQIQELVKTRDAAALASRPQVQILTLQPETAQSIAESLNGLSTKISVGTTSTQSYRSNSSRGDSNRYPSFRIDSRSNNRR